MHYMYNGYLMQQWVFNTLTMAVVYVLRRFVSSPDYVIETICNSFLIFP